MEWRIALGIVMALGVTSCSQIFDGENSSFSSSATVGVGNEGIADQDDADEAQFKTENGREQSFDIVKAGAIVDIVFAIDTSGSMDTEKAFLEQNMKTFMDLLSKAQIDSQVTAIGSTEFLFPVGLPPEKFQVVNQKIGSHDMIRILTGFFQGGAYPLPFREGANIEVVMITDDNGQRPGELAVDFKGIDKKKTIVNGIIGINPGISPTNPECTIAAVGTEHQKLADLTGGSKYDLCEKDWNGLLIQLSKNIVERSFSFFLDSAPDLSQDVLVKLDGVALAPEQYTIDEKGQVTLSKDIVLPEKGVLTVFYFTK
ncbi:MAG: hypothetical protein AB7T49_20890 [Oligoflexales bacterium]